MLKRNEIVVGVALASAFWVLLIALNSDQAAYFQICKINEYTGNENCAPHNIPYVVTWYIGYWFDAASAVITAAATAVIATFTITIYLINKSQLAHSQQVERAYISGGGVPARERRVVSGVVGQVASGQIGDEHVYYILTGKFELHINNHGKTPGRLMHVAVEFCDAGSIPHQPQYRPIFNPDWIGPGTQSRIYGHYEVPPGMANPVVYGRLYYRDIFGSRIHSSGFIQSLDMTNGGTALIEPPSSKYTDWD